MITNVDKCFQFRFGWFLFRYCMQFHLRVIWRSFEGRQATSSTLVSDQVQRKTSTWKNQKTFQGYQPRNISQQTPLALLDDAPSLHQYLSIQASQPQMRTKEPTQTQNTARSTTRSFYCSPSFLWSCTQSFIRSCCWSIYP
ncbi:uncharacterized protein [Rutidosis leptorrhynchoides]|uniref:uncharacterized protein isoform X2 n=1 Tax=Rutidosis leptorrhynchoides TaxID=125765 RepID=UPI003A993CDE